MRPARPLLVSLLTSAIAASAALAEPVAFRIDPGHSKVGFNVRHFFTRVPGHFNEFSGKILHDEKALAGSSVEVEIKTSSIDTDLERRDNHLRSPDFFAADSFPTIAFKSTRITPVEGDKFKIDGNLTIRGVTRPVTLDATFLGMGVVDSKTGAVRAGWEASTTVDRKDFGIVWNRMLDQGGAMLGDDVNILIAVEAVKEAPAAAAKPGMSGAKAENK
jgi:polyisoprenoid-binding protein YceI